MRAIDNSVIVIDKPCGHTSHEITTFVRKLIGVPRAGHAGTLDPNVSGVLPVALGRATKLLRYIAGADKTYVGIIKFREMLPEKRIQALFASFTGEITQTPPKISAVRKRPRKRTVHSLRLIEISEDNPRLALFEARVDAGTYIRTLCEDMGKTCGGARMEELRRTAVGGITEDDASTMQELRDAIWFRRDGDDSLLGKMLRAPESLILLPKVLIKRSALESILSGAQVMVPAIESMEGVSPGQRVAMYCGDLFIGVGVAAIGPGGLQSGKGPAVTLERVHRPSIL